MKFEKLQPGMKVYDVGKTKMGNTTLTTVSIWPVTIQSVDPETRTVMASWNGNQARKFYERSYSKWKAEMPLTIEGGFGRRRLATREEIAAHKAKLAEEANSKGAKP